MYAVTKSKILNMKAKYKILNALNNIIIIFDFLLWRKKIDKLFFEINCYCTTHFLIVYGKQLKLWLYGLYTKIKWNHFYFIFLSIKNIRMWVSFCKNKLDLFHNKNWHEFKSCNILEIHINIFVLSQCILTNQ